LLTGNLNDPRADGSAANVRLADIPLKE